MQQKIRKRWKLLVVILGMLVFLAACAQNAEEPESGLLTVGMLAEQNINAVANNWIEAFLHQNKDIEVEYEFVIDQSHITYREPGEIDGPEKITELLGGPNPPDIVALGYEDFQEAIAQNLLAPLEPMMQDSSLTTDRLEPAVLEHLRDPDGQLYGLAPVINSSALVYNKDIFNRAQISYPSDGMSWDETFELARQVAHQDSSDDVYGITFGNRYENLSLEDVLYWLGSGSGLKLYEGQQMLVNNEEWQHVFDKVFRLTAEGVFPTEEPETSVRGNPFYSGDVAMAIMGDRQLFEWLHFLEDATDEEGFLPFEWDIVTVPVQPHARDQGVGISFEPIFAISANAASPKTAWKLLEFMHSDQWVNMSINKNQLLTFSHASEGFGMDFHREAFFQLRPVEELIGRPGPFSRNTYHNDVIRSVTHYYFLMQMGEVTVEEVFANWEREGNRLLQEKE